MRVRLVTRVYLPRWKAPFALPRHAQTWREMWHKVVALVLPRDRDRCPKCGSRDFTRSHRKNFLEFGISKFVLPYRCQHCYLRFFRPVESGNGEDGKRYRANYAAS
jgi:hypothetical protein